MSVWGGVSHSLDRHTGCKKHCVRECLCVKAAQQQRSFAGGGWRQPATGNVGNFFLLFFFIFLLFPPLAARRQEKESEPAASAGKGERDLLVVVPLRAFVVVAHALLLTFFLHALFVVVSFSLRAIN